MVYIYVPLPRWVDNTRRGHCVCQSASETNDDVLVDHTDNSSSHLQAADRFGVENQDSLRIEAGGVAEVAARSHKSCPGSRSLANLEVSVRLHRDVR